MDHAVKLEQAKAIASLLPALMRQLFALDDGLAANLPLAQLRVCAFLYDKPFNGFLVALHYGLYRAVRVVPDPSGEAVTPCRLDRGRAV